jgi:hypothetical protein
LDCQDRRCSFLLLACVTLACRTISTEVGEVTGKTQQKEEAAKVALIQIQLMRFADDYVAEILQGTVRLEPVTAPERLMVMSLGLNQATAAYDIASGPSPKVGVLDMVVLVTLTRSVCEDYWVGTIYGARAQPLLEALRKLEERAWALAAGVLTTSEQQQAIRDAIASWRASHPEVHEVAFIRLSHLGGGAGDPRFGLGTPGSILGAIGLDPLGGLDPAVRQVEQTRILAERGFFYAKRAPRLLDLQAQQLLMQLAQQPPSREAFQIAERVTGSMEAFASTARGLPGLLDREREAALRQVLDALRAQEGRAQALLAEARATLEAGNSTAASVDATIRSLDDLMARLQQPPPPGTPPSKPFDVDEYTRALRQLGESARELQTLLDAVGREGSSIDVVVRRASEESRGVVDHAFRRALVLVAALVTSVLAAAIAYRWAAARIQARVGGPDGHGPRRPDRE